MNTLLRVRPTATTLPQTNTTKQVLQSSHPKPVLHKERGCTKRLFSPLVLCWWHLATLFLLQIENNLVYGIPIQGGANLFSQLLFRQSVLYAVSFLLAYTVHSTLSAFLGAAIVFFANGFCVCEQMVFKLNGMHTRPSMAEQTVEFRAILILFGSFVTELDVVFAFNVGFLLVSTWYLLSLGWIIGETSGRSRSSKCCCRYLRCIRCIRCNKHGINTNASLPGSYTPIPTTHQHQRGKIPTRPRLFHHLSWIFLAGCVTNVGYLVLSFTVMETSHTRLEPHPILVMVSDWVGVVTGYQQIFKGSHVFHNFDHRLQHKKPRNSLLYPQLADASLYGTSNIKPEEHLWMKEVRKHVAVDRRHRNQVRSEKQPLVVVCVVLESVGAHNVFPSNINITAGTFDSKITPTLAKMQQEGGLVFTAQYDYYPSTVRSHVPMFTGGPSMMMGSLDHQLSHVYQGPTMLKWFKKQGFRTGAFAASDLNFEKLGTWYENLGFDKLHHWAMASKEYKARAALNSWGGDDHSMFNLAADWVEMELGKNKQALAAGKRAQPIYVHLMPNAPHHPYSVPKDPLWSNQRPFSDHSSLDKYNNAIHYTDTALGQFRARLDRLGLADRLVYAIAGDHGEAFGQAGGHHPNNFLHKNHLYEENIRSFLFLHGPALLAQHHSGVSLKNPGQYRVSHRVSRVADMFPTVAAFVSGQFEEQGDPDLPAAAMARKKNKAQRPIATPFSPGQNLLSAHWTLRLVFFHRIGSTAEWGLIDGQFKFIEKQQDLDGKPIDASKTEVYDLWQDPKETYNLATHAKFANKIIAWRKATVTNYWVAHCAFTTRLQGYKIAHASGSGCKIMLDMEQEMERAHGNLKGQMPIQMPIQMPSLTQPGPKTIMFGFWNQNQVFQPITGNQTIFCNAKTVVVFTEWIPFDKDTPVVMEWRKQHDGNDENIGEVLLSNTWNWKIEAGWHTTHFNVYPHPLPMVPGKYEFVIWSNPDGTRENMKALGRKSILVEGMQRVQPEPSRAAATPPGPKTISFGYYNAQQKFQAWQTVPSNASLVVAYTKWVPFHQDTSVVMEWQRIGEDGEIALSNDWTWKVAAGWDTTYFHVFPHPSPMLPGEWELIIWLNNKGTKEVGKKTELGRKSVSVV